MAIAKIQVPVDNTQKLLSSFAHAQLSAIDPKSIKQNSFQLFAIAAFLYGAISQLGKQSTLPEHLVHDYLHNILCNEFGLPRHNIEGLVSSISRMMEKYYLLDNIYHEGEAAAELWLTDENADCTELEKLLNSYNDFTLMDMKAAGMKSGEMSQPENRSQTDHPAKKFPWLIVLFGTVAFATVLSLLHYFLII